MSRQNISAFRLWFEFFNLFCGIKKSMFFSLLYLWTAAHSACVSGIILFGKHRNYLQVLYKKRKKRKVVSMEIVSNDRCLISGLESATWRSFLVTSDKPRYKSSCRCQILLCFSVSLSELYVSRQESSIIVCQVSRDDRPDIWSPVLFFFPPGRKVRQMGVLFSC